MMSTSGSIRSCNVCAIVYDIDLVTHNNWCLRVVVIVCSRWLIGISISLVPLSTIVAAYHRICRYWATFICVCIDCIHFTSIKEVYMIHMATIKLRIRQVNNRVHRIILCLEMGMIQSEIAYLVVTCPFWDRYFSWLIFQVGKVLIKRLHHAIILTYLT